MYTIVTTEKAPTSLTSPKVLNKGRKGGEKKGKKESNVRTSSINHSMYLVSN